MITPKMTPIMMPVEPLVSTADAPVDMNGGDTGGGGDGEGGGGGGISSTVGGVTTASTTIETPVTFASIAVALLGLLVALAIVDCTETAVAVVVWMLTSTMTLPDVTATVTDDGSTTATVAIALRIWVCTRGVNEEMSPASRRVNPTTLIAALALCSLQVLRGSIPAIVAAKASCIPGCILEICWVMTAPHQTENPASVHVEAHPMHPLSRR